MLSKKSKTIISTAMIFSALVSSSFLVTACVATPQNESTGQYIDSSAITAKVKSELLADEGVKGLPITVKTYKNVVQLSGFVDTPAQKARAINITRNVPGVRAVKDSLIVK